MRATSWPAAPQMGGRGRGSRRLMAELVGGDEQDAHRSRLRAIEPQARSIVEARVAGAQRCLDDRGGVLAAGEEEPEVAVALGQRHAPAAAAAIVISSPITPGTPARRPDRRTARACPARGIGSIITPDAPRLAARSSSGMPERVAQHDLLEAMPGAEPQRARAQPADRARRDLDHPRRRRRRRAARRAPGLRPARSRRAPRAVTSRDARQRRRRRGATA